MASNSSPIRVLYMEDDAGLARLVQKRLNRLGFEVDTVADGTSGLDTCRATAYDVIIVDHDMPGVTGLEVIRKLCTSGMDSPVIMLTGQGDQQLAVDALKSGAADYLVKDVEARYLHILPTVLDLALKNSNMAREKERVEKELEASEAFNKAILEHSNDGIAVVSIDGDLQFMSPGMERILRQDIESVGSISFWSDVLINTSEERVRFMQSWDRIRNEGVGFEKIIAYEGARNENRWGRFFSAVCPKNKWSSTGRTSQPWLQCRTNWLDPTNCLPDKTRSWKS